jgi:gliding motility-associated-like protein
LDTSLSGCARIFSILPVTLIKQTVMRRLLLTGFFLAIALFSFAQDFTNKGKEFWIGYGYHVRMPIDNGQRMSLYITSDVNTSGKVEIPSVGFSQNFTITANTVSVINIPQSAILNDEGTFNSGIHVSADRGVVVYSHIYYSAVSGSTVCLPVATLGREYYSINYRQSSNENLSNSYFFVVATEDNTTVEITPSVLTKGGHPADVPYNVTLNKGQIYQVLGSLVNNNSPFTGLDLTGSKIRSINTGGGCKKIAVFCGSGKISIGCGAGSSDNLYQQMYPTSTWGKKFITVPSKVRSLNYYRIVRPDPSSVVKLNGAIINPVFFTNNFYYEFSNTQTNVIESTQPIMVAQYFTSQQNCVDPNVSGDPEMIYLNPLEQTIDKATLYCSSNFSIGSHYLNVSIRNLGTGVSSFTLDGVNRAASFVTLPQDPTYSYAQFDISAGTHNISADSGFNAIVYGFGNAESYGYSAGTNLKDLYQFITINNQYATVNFPAGCRNSPLKFSMTFPYQPTRIQWIFGTALNAMGLADTSINAPVFDSTWVVNDRTLYRYKLDKYFMVTTPGIYPIKVIATNPTADGCTGEQEINYDLQVYDPPVAAFSMASNGCITSPVVLQDNTNPAPRSITQWYWNFGDAQTSTVKNPSHLYTAPGSFTIKFAVITDVGCLSDTISNSVSITDPPVAKFIVQGISCEKKEVTLEDQSTIPSGSLNKWSWNFGDASAPVVATSNAPVKHIYAAAGTYNATLQVESLSGCKSLVYTFPVVVHPQPLSAFTLPAAVCLPSGMGQFTDASAIADGSQSQFTYLWDFGDLQTSTQKDPQHQYTATGPYNIKLTVTSKDGCVDDSIKVLSAIYPQAKADFTILSEVCLGIASSFTDKSNGSGSAVTQWHWDFTDASPAATTQNPTHTYTTSGTFDVSLYITTDKGCNSDTVKHAAIVNSLPGANFTVTPPVCETQQLTFTDGSVPNSGTITKWTWNFGDNGTSTQQSPVHTFATASAGYNVSLSVETDKGCKSATTIKPVKVNYLPATDFLSPDICLNDPTAQFFDNSTIQDNTQSQFTYAWDFGDGGTSTQKDGQHRYASVGNYNVKLTVTSKDGCVKNITKPFTVNGSVPLANFAVNTPTELCSNKEVSIVDASTVDFGKIVKVEIYWDYLNDPTIKTTDATPSAGKLYTHKYPDAGTAANKQIRYVAYSGVTCLNQFSRIITLKASPEIQFDPMQAVCQEIQPFNITAAREIYGLAGAGVFSGTGVNAAGEFNPGVAKPGTHTLKYSFAANNGCVTEKTQTIRVSPTPLVDAGPDRYLLEGGFITIDTKTSGNNLTYVWTPAIYLDNDKIAKPKVSATQDILYTVTATSADGCVAGDDVLIKVLKEIKVPNAFSPNGDGINDTWDVKYLDSYPGCTIEIYNRYGQAVYRSTGYTRQWDGRVNGNPLPVGVYYWIINPKNGRPQVNGSVTIIR